MARYSEAEARLGRTGIKRGTSNRSNQGTGNGENNFPISVLRYNMGDNKRITIPKFKFSDGTEGVLILGDPIHKVSKGFLQKTSASGSSYDLFEIRCMNPNRQIYTTKIEFAKEEKHCVFCEIAKLEGRRRNKLIKEAKESNPIDKDNKEELKSFYAKLDAQDKVKSSFNAEKRESVLNQFIVALEFETAEVPDVDADGNPVLDRKKQPKKVIKPILDENGVPKYKLVFVKVYDAMLQALTLEVEHAFDSGLLVDDADYSYKTGLEDTEGNPIEVVYPFIDLQFDYPVEDTKMKSGKNRTIRATPSAQSIITPEFVQHIMDKSDEIVKIAEDNFYKANHTLKPLNTEEEQISLMADAGAYYKELVKEYAITPENRAEPEEQEDGTYSVQLTDEEWEKVSFKAISEERTTSEVEMEFKKAVLAEKGIDGEPYKRDFNQNTKKDTETEESKEESKETKKAVKKVAKATKVKEDVKTDEKSEENTDTVDDFFSEFEE